MSDATANVSPAFQHVPVNPYSQRVRAMQDAANHPVPADPQSPVQPPADPQPPVTPVAPPADPQPPVAPIPPAAPQYNPEDVQRLYDGYTQAQQQVQQQAEQMKAMQARLDEYDQLRRQAAIQAAIPDDAFSELGTVDPEDARHIGQTVLQSVSAPLDSIRQELAEQRQMIAQQQQANQQFAAQSRLQTLSNEVLKAHPDFYNLMNTAEYKTFMSQRDGYDSKSRDQRAAEELMAGNPAYVVDLLNRFKGARPSVQSIASVAPVQTPTQTAAPAAPAAPDYTLRELNDLYQMRRISHDEYIDRLKKLRAANTI